MMKAKGRRFALFAAMAVLASASPANAPKHGGGLKIRHMDNPPSASILEEATVSVPAAFMSVYNNLVMFDQHVARSSLKTVIPDLATKWEWQDDRQTLVFNARDGVHVHG